MVEPTNADQKMIDQNLETMSIWSTGKEDYSKLLDCVLGCLPVDPNLSNPSVLSSRDRRWTGSDRPLEKMCEVGALLRVDRS